MKISERILVILLPSIALLACGGSQQASETPSGPAPEYEIPAAPAPEAAPESPPAAAPEPEPAPAAEAPRSLDLAFQAKSGSKLAGKAMLAETAEGVTVTLNLENVSPGDHGAHVHEKGDCSAPDAASAGGHYNPDNLPHALPTVPARHLGDLGNITIGKDGKGTLELTIPGANLKPDDPKSFIGRAIIVHAKKDDGGQPVGNAGGRIGCVEIK